MDLNPVRDLCTIQKVFGEGFEAGPNTSARVSLLNVFESLTIPAAYVHEQIIAADITEEIQTKYSNYLFIYIKGFNTTLFPGGPPPQY